VFGSGDCVEAPQVVERLSSSAVSGVLVGRGALRNPWIFSQAASARGGGKVGDVSLEARGQFLLEYIDLLLNERVDESAGFRHVAPGQPPQPAEPAGRTARGRERWVINKLRALGSWYTKGLDGGSQPRVMINSAESLEHLRDIIRAFFLIREPVGC
jgi:tRNA-dihydrouridine synthase